MHPLELTNYIGHLRGPCSYLDDRTQSLLFLEGSSAADSYRDMLDLGYRRHGVHLYRPDCVTCRECRVLRVPLKGFKMRSSQMRVYKKGKEIFEVRFATPEYTPQKARIYERYLAFQHGRTELIDESTYRDFFVDSFLGENTRELQLYAGDVLCGVGIVDLLRDALSSVYFFFDPDYSRFSPGTYSILAEIESAARSGLTYYYPGYYIRDCAAMRYKMNFLPCEIKDITAGIWTSCSNESV